MRPTSDALRETLFNILHVPASARVLDAFAGTGALGLEALSRGAASVTFVERDRAAVAVIRQNTAACGAEADCSVVSADFLRAAAPGRRPPWATDRFDIVLLDPPYDVEDLPAVLAAGAGCLADDGQLVLEHRRGRDVPEDAGGLRLVRRVTAGDSALSFYRPAGPEDP